MFSKETDNNVFYIIEAVSILKEAVELRVVSAYQSIKKEESRVSDAKAPSRTAKTGATYSSKENVTQRNNSVNSEKKFSLKEPVEETKDLMALHNITETNLLKTLELSKRTVKIYLQRVVIEDRSNRHIFHLT